ncbi:hypothetical protein [Novosphingobium colocasiae]|uniref:hypothetical protein n=1 Tax=Novosphingobium colocasiae TaxID=1256513 RepID=UPI0035B24AAD
MIDDKQMLYRRNRFAPHGSERTGSLIFDRQIAEKREGGAEPMRIWSGGRFHTA